MTARITVVGGIKGGSGKTTVAINLAIMLSLAGRDVLLIDADNQGTSTDFTALRNELRPEGAGYTCIALDGKSVYTETRKLAEKYDDIIIDCGGRDTASQRAALTIGHRLLVPFVPRSFDIWTLPKLETLLEEMRSVNPDLEAYAFLNRADPSGSDNDEAAAVVAAVPGLKAIDTPIGHRKAYSNVVAEGISVVEMKKKRDRKAIEEVHALYDAIFPEDKLTREEA